MYIDFLVINIINSLLQTIVHIHIYKKHLKYKHIYINTYPTQSSLILTRQQTHINALIDNQSQLIPRSKHQTNIV